MPQITQGNRLYLYQLLSQELGIGKQTKIELAEEVLVADDVLPSDLDCADVRELMEALGDIVRVTVFKRGRVYVTVLSNPEFDGYLQAPAEERAPQQRKAQGRKSWKQKRAPKIPKPAKPKPKGRPQEVEEPIPLAGVEGVEGVASAEPAALGAGATAAPTPMHEEPTQTDVTEQAQPTASRAPEQAMATVATAPEVSPAGAAPAAPVTPITTSGQAEGATGQEDGANERAGGHPETASAKEGEPAAEASPSASGKADTPASGDSKKSSSEPAAETTQTAGKTPGQHAKEPSTDTATLAGQQVGPAAEATDQTTPDARPTSETVETADDKAAEPSAMSAEGAVAPGERGQEAPSLDAGTPVREEHCPSTDAATESKDTGTAAADEEPLFYAGAHTSIRLVSMPAEEPESTPSRTRIFPDSFAHDVRMDNEPLAALYSILPFDVDPVALLDEDWRFSESIESYTYEDARLRFPLRYLRSNDEPVEVTLRRVAPGTSGKRWLLENVAVGDEVGLWGLSVADVGAWSHMSDAWRRPHALVSPRRELARFAHLGQPQALLESLADAAEDEWWGHDYAILSDYLAITFWRAKGQGKIAVSLDGRHAALDTGLVSTDGCPVLMHFEERSGKVPWTFDHFGTDGRGLTPEPPTYVSELSHITLVAGAGVRLSREVVRSHGDTITSHVEKAVRYAVRNHRVATPAFDPQTDEMRLLVPIRDDEGEVLALVLAPDTLTGYIALSVMSREAAYACARAVSAEQPGWLRPE